MSKPYLLAIETTTAILSVALLDEAGVAAEWNQRLEREHSTHLLPRIVRLLEEARVDGREQVGALAVSIGPGSYTGIRIGIATAQGLSAGWDVPVYGIATLEAMARSARGHRGSVWPVVDARQDHVFTAPFRAEGGEVSRLGGEIRISRAAFLQELERSPDPLVSGPAATVLAADVRRLSPSAVVLEGALALPRAALVGELGARLWKEGKAGDAVALEPLYLRPAAISRTPFQPD